MSTLDCLKKKGFEIYNVTRCSEEYDEMKNYNLLLVGVGGLGCEILKCLILEGFSQISIVDHDCVTVSNLNRQLFYRESDIGRPKSLVAAELLNRKYRHFEVNIIPYVKRVEDFSLNFFLQFQAVIAGLDNIDSRRVLNSFLHSLVQFDQKTSQPIKHTVKPYFDAGTEGFRGQCRVILPFFTSCFECSLPLFPDTTRARHPICTVSHIPLTPENCIRKQTAFKYAYLHEWNKTFPDKEPDVNDEGTIKWIFSKASERAENYGIKGVTILLTLDVVKGILPAVVSTNALIAANLTTEVVKVKKYGFSAIQNYFMYMGDSGIHTLTFNYEVRADCPVCSRKILFLEISFKNTLQDLVNKLKQHPQFPLRRPTLATRQTLLYWDNPAVDQKQLLDPATTWRTLVDQKIVSFDEPLYVTDPLVKSTIEVHLRYMDFNSL